MSYDIKIDSDLLSVYSEIRLGCIRFSADVKEPDDNFWQDLNDNILPQVRQKIDGVEWGEVPGVKGSRLAYKAFGRNPGRYRVSSEALLRRVKRGDELYHINSVVDVNNLISVTSGLSVGSYDLAQVKGAITLRKAMTGEGYTGIGKEFIDMENMLVLSDDEGLFGSSMSDSTRAMVTNDTKEVLVVIYCFEDDVDLNSLVNDARDAFVKYAGAQNAECWIV